jgi:hypothetical protein
MHAGEELFSEALLAVILAALCLEAFVNEMGEEILPSADLKDFLMSRRKYQKPDGIGAVSWKIITIFDKKWSYTLSPGDQLLQDVESLFDLRNALVHYKLGESAARSYLLPPTRIANEETGEVMTTFDFMQRATRVEQPLVSRVNTGAAVQAYNAALRVLKLWNEKADAPRDALSAHEELRAP